MVVVPGVFPFLFFITSNGKGVKKDYGILFTILIKFEIFCFLFFSSKILTVSLVLPRYYHGITVVIPWLCPDHTIAKI